MFYQDNLSLSDLFQLFQESDEDITDMAYDYYQPGQSPPKSLIASFHKTLKNNVLAGEALLEKLSEEFEYPMTMGSHYHMQWFDVAQDVHKGIAESHDTIIQLEKTHPFLPRPKRRALTP